MNFRQDAMSKLYPHWATIDNDTDVKDKNGNKITIDEVKISEEIQNLQAEYNSKQYQRDRATSYPSIQDQLDMQYWDAVNGTNKWQEAVAKVKTDNPKPE